MPPAEPHAPAARQAHPNHQPLIAVLAAVCAGIVVDRLWPLPLEVWGLVAATGLVTWPMLQRRQRDVAAIALLLTAMAGAGGFWHHCRWSLFDADELGRFARADSQPVCFEAVVRSGPRRMEAPPHDPLRSVQIGDRTRLELAAVAVRDGQQWRRAAGQLTLVVDGHLLGPRVGDRVRVFGQLFAPAAPQNPGQFDFAAQARGQRRLCRVRSGFPDCVTITARSSGWSVARMVDRLRSAGHDLLHRYLSPERSGLAAAMFLGLREELDEDAAQGFLETGTIHLLVISGLNVGILAGCLFWALRFRLLSPGWALVGVVGITMLYAVVTDAQPPVVRATVMVVVFCAARWLGRQPVGYNALAAAALIVLLLNPAELFSSGTQLSFLAVAAIIAFRQATEVRRPVDPLDRLLWAARPWWQRAGWRGAARFWQSACLSTVIWLVVLPLCMARFHLVSPAAIVLGPVLGLPVAVAMGTGFGVLLLGNLVPPLAHVCGIVCDANLWFISQGVELARTAPGSYFWVSGPDAWWLIGCYVLVLGWMLVPRWRPPRRWCWGLAALWLAAGLSASSLAKARRDELTCTFLSVGHGCAVVLELPDGRTLLYDAGHLGSPVAGSRTIAGYLWSRGIHRLDAVVISHADIDHYNALPGLLRQFQVGTVYVSNVMFDRPVGGVGVLRAAIERSGTSVREIWSGDRLRGSPDVQIDVLHPPRFGVPGSDNANSIVLAVEHAGRRLLLTGDLESPGLEDVLAEEPLRCDVLMAPHHGSRFSDPPGMADWSRPGWVVISGGGWDETAEVVAAYRERGSKLISTADAGAVQVRIVGGSLEVAGYGESAGTR